MTASAARIEQITANVADAFAAVGEKGGTIPESQTSDNLGSAIRTISTSVGMYAFHVDENGHLILVYDTQEAPPFSIDDDGHLVYECDTTPPPLSIVWGRLIYTFGEE